MAMSLISTEDHSTFLLCINWRSTSLKLSCRNLRFPGKLWSRGDHVVVRFFIGFQLGAAAAFFWFWAPSITSAPVIFFDEKSILFSEAVLSKDISVGLQTILFGICCHLATFLQLTKTPMRYWPCYWICPGSTTQTFRFTSKNGGKHQLCLSCQRLLSRKQDGLW